MSNCPVNVVLRKVHIAVLKCRHRIGSHRADVCAWWSHKLLFKRLGCCPVQERRSQSSHASHQHLMIKSSLPSRRCISDPSGDVEVCLDLQTCKVYGRMVIASGRTSSVALAQLWLRSLFDMGMSCIHFTNITNTRGRHPMMTVICCI